MKKLLNLSLFLLIIQGMCASCTASGKKELKAILTANKNDGYGKVIKDSVANIIFDARHITCQLQSKAQEDTLRQDTECRLPTKAIPIVQFVFFNSDNFKSDQVVYGMFESWACYKFEASKKRVVYLELDFGLGKWRLYDKDKKQICQQDMNENRMSFIHLTRLFFPNDVTLKILYNNLKARL